MSRFDLTLRSTKQPPRPSFYTYYFGFNNDDSNIDNQNSIQANKNKS